MPRRSTTSPSKSAARKLTHISLYNTTSFNTATASYRMHNCSLTISFREATSESQRIRFPARTSCSVHRSVNKFIPKISKLSWTSVDSVFHSRINIGPISIFPLFLLVPTVHIPMDICTPQGHDHAAWGLSHMHPGASEVRADI